MIHPTHYMVAGKVLIKYDPQYRTAKYKKNYALEYIIAE
jgi:hypothetical protein